MAQKGIIMRKLKSYLSVIFTVLVLCLLCSSANGYTDIVLDDGAEHAVRYTSDDTVYVESFVNDKWSGRYLSADGRINVSHEKWVRDAFHIEINDELVSTGWSFISAGEIEKTDRGARHFVVELSNNQQPLNVKVHTVLNGTPIMVRWLEITNTSRKSVALTALSPWSGLLWPGEEFTLGYYDSKEWAYEGWLKWEHLEPGTKQIRSQTARGHDDPFFLVRNDKTGEYCIGHLAWSMYWEMAFSRDSEGLSFKIGPSSDEALRVIAPRETIETPAVHLGLVSGDLDDAVQAMHDHVRGFVLPKRDLGRSYLIQYLVPADQGYYMPFDEASAFKCVDVAEAIGAELFILDFGWWDVTCDWIPSPTRFPRGLKPLADYIHEKGMLFGIYTETEGGRGNIAQSKVFTERSEWMTGSNNLIVNLSIPEAAAWVESEICKMVEDFDIDLYRLDYNPSILGGFDKDPVVQLGTQKRDGFVEHDNWRYYEAFYGTYERIHKKYPDLILQQASAGGARNDLGTVGRFHEAYLTDGLWLPRELQIYSGLTLGLPPEIFAILHGAHSGGRGIGLPQRTETLLRMSYATSTPQIFVGAVAPNVEQLRPERREMFLHYGKIFKEFIRPLLPTCKVYHHEPINSRGDVLSSGWFVMEYASPDRKKGWAVLVRTGAVESDIYNLRLRGLDPAKNYRVTFDSLGSTAKMEGSRLTVDGLPIRLEDAGSSELLLFEAK